MAQRQYRTGRSVDSYFDGGLFGYIVRVLLGGLLSFVTLGLGAPWAIVMIYRWEIEHTVVDGYRLQFSGTGGGLFMQWLKWWFLTLITLGIYGFWVHIKLLDWKACHTTFTNDYLDF